MKTASEDIRILRSLAQAYSEIAGKPVMEQRRDLWRRQNSFHGDRPLIYVRAFAWSEMADSACRCTEPFFRRYEDWFRRHLFWYSLVDDSVFEPWITVGAVHRCSGWGLAGKRDYADTPGRGSFKYDYPIKDLDDIDKLTVPVHDIDEEQTRLQAERLYDAIGEIIPINLDRSPAYTVWHADLSTDLGYLRGIENFMMDMFDNPEWLHRLVGFMSAGVLRTHDQAEAAGDWGLAAHQNQAMPYSEELPDPKPNMNGVKRNSLWCFTAAQEFTGVSPAMHEEFLLRYQLPIMKKFGLVSYGCCENLTHKIDMLRQIPNLRRIAVSPMADVALCAEKIASDYILSYRPSPTDMVGYGLDDETVRNLLRNDLRACRDCHVDITLKDVETVQQDPNRVRHWVELCREVIDELWP